LEFVGRPLRKFFDLRGEVIRRLIEFANVRAHWKELPDSSGAVSGNLEEIDLSAVDLARLEEAQRTFRDLASQKSFGNCRHWQPVDWHEVSAFLFDSRHMIVSAARRWP
jgi:hypothetical protein